MREVICIRIRNHRFIVDPVVDALVDIKRREPFKCMHGTGIYGYQTYTLDGKSTNIIEELPIKVSSGRSHCTQFPSDPSYTTNDWEYMLQYNQTIIHHLDSSRASTKPYTKTELKNGRYKWSGAYIEPDIDIFDEED